MSTISLLQSGGHVIHSSISEKGKKRPSASTRRGINKENPKEKTVCVYFCLLGFGNELFVFCVSNQTTTEVMLVRNSLTEALQSRLPAAQ